MKTEPKHKKKIEALTGLSLGISVVVAILMGIGIGYWLKNLTGNIWLFWLGVFWGIGGAIRNIYIEAKKAKKALDEEAKFRRERLNNINE